MQDRELVEKLFGLRIFQSSVTLVPASAFKEETMNVHTFLRMVDRLALNATVLALNDLLEDIGSIFDFIE